MLTGVLLVTSVDPVGGEELATGELTSSSTRGALPFRSTRGESVHTRSPALADRITNTLRTLDSDRGHPVRARFEITEDRETLTNVDPAVLSPTALARMLVERTRDARLTRDQAIARITPIELEAAGVFMLDASASTAFARGLAASAGAAPGRLALPDDFEEASTDARVLVIDDAGPEDAIAIRACAAIIATSGGLTADAAIAARALRKPCVVSAPIQLGLRGCPARGEWVTVDGSTGEIHVGALPTTWSPATPFAADLLSWLEPASGERPGEALIRAQIARAQAAPA